MWTGKDAVLEWLESPWKKPGSEGKNVEAVILATWVENPGNKSGGSWCWTDGAGATFTSENTSNILRSVAEWLDEELPEKDPRAHYAIRVYRGVEPRIDHSAVDSSKIFTLTNEALLKPPPENTVKEVLRGFGGDLGGNGVAQSTAVLTAALADSHQRCMNVIDWGFDHLQKCADVVMKAQQGAPHIHLELAKIEAEAKVEKQKTIREVGGAFAAPVAKRFMDFVENIDKPST